MEKIKVTENDREIIALFQQYDITDIRLLQEINKISPVKTVLNVNHNFIIQTPFNAKNYISSNIPLFRYFVAGVGYIDFSNFCKYKEQVIQILYNGINDYNKVLMKINGQININGKVKFNGKKWHTYGIKYLRQAQKYLTFPLDYTLQNSIVSSLYFNPRQIISLSILVHYINKIDILQHDRGLKCLAYRLLWDLMLEMVVDIEDDSDWLQRYITMLNNLTPEDVNMDKTCIKESEDNKFLYTIPEMSWVFVDFSILNKTYFDLIDLMQKWTGITGQYYIDELPEDRYSTFIIEGLEKINNSEMKHNFLVMLNNMDHVIQELSKHSAQNSYQLWTVKDIKFGRVKISMVKILSLLAQKYKLKFLYIRYPKQLEEPGIVLLKYEPQY